MRNCALHACGEQHQASSMRWCQCGLIWTATSRQRCSTTTDAHQFTPQQPLGHGDAGSWLVRFTPPSCKLPSVARSCCLTCQHAAWQRRRCLLKLPPGRQPHAIAVASCPARCMAGHVHGRRVHTWVVHYPGWLASFVPVGRLATASPVAVAQQQGNKLLRCTARQPLLRVHCGLPAGGTPAAAPLARGPARRMCARAYAHERRAGRTHRSRMAAAPASSSGGPPRSAPEREMPRARLLRCACAWPGAVTHSACAARASSNKSPSRSDTTCANLKQQEPADTGRQLERGLLLGHVASHVSKHACAMHGVRCCPGRERLLAGQSPLAEVAPVLRTTCSCAPPPAGR